MGMGALDPVLGTGDLQKLSALALAHVGDGVYSLMVRTFLCQSGTGTSRGLHTQAALAVSAPEQAKAAARIALLLTEEEAAVYRRGRNAKVNSVPARSAEAEYHAATGLEALFGWLWLRGERDRLEELFKAIMEAA